MLKSVARRRLALKTSALGLAGTLALFVGSIVGLATPAEASTAAATKQFDYTCPAGLITGTTIRVGVTAPDSVTAGGTFDVTLNIPTVTVTPAPTAATTLQVNATLTVTGGTVTDPGDKAGPAVPTTGTTVAGDVKYKVTATAGTTGKVSVKPAALKLALASGAGTTTCTTTSTEVVDVTIGTGTGTGSDMVEYTCSLTNTSTTDNEYPVYPEIKVELTPPSTARANEEVSLSWKLTNQDEQEKIKVPAAGLPTGSKLFMTFAGSGAGLPATLTGEAAVTGGTTGADITLPTVIVKAKATTAGTASLKPGEISIGTSATAPAIKCLLDNASAVKSYTYTVSAGTGTSPSPSPSPTPSNTSASPKPTRTVTAIVTHTPVGGNGKVTKTPKGAAETGGGGELGPDGRMFVVTGSLIVLAAAAGGLVLRRRTASRG